MTPTAVLESTPAPAATGASDYEHYEIVDGERVELPPMSAYAVRVASNLGRKIGNFAESENLGEAVVEVLFRLPLELERVRKPDVAYVSYQRWPKDRRMPVIGNAWDVAPDLAVEVVSPTDLVEEITDKVVEYFQAGVRLVWIVHPRVRMIHIFESLAQTRFLTAADELDGGAVFPGFRMPVTALFPETTLA